MTITPELITLSILAMLQGATYILFMAGLGAIGAGAIYLPARGFILLTQYLSHKLAGSCEPTRNQPTTYNNMNPAITLSPCNAESYLYYRHVVRLDSTALHKFETLKAHAAQTLNSGKIHDKVIKFIDGSVYSHGTDGAKAFTDEDSFKMNMNITDEYSDIIREYRLMQKTGQDT